MAKQYTPAPCIAPEIYILGDDTSSHPDSRGRRAQTSERSDNILFTDSTVNSRIESYKPSSLAKPLYPPSCVSSPSSPSVSLALDPQETQTEGPDRGTTSRVVRLPVFRSLSCTFIPVRICLTTWRPCPICTSRKSRSDSHGSLQRCPFAKEVPCLPESPLLPSS